MFRPLRSLLGISVQNVPNRIKTRFNKNCKLSFDPLEDRVTPTAMATVLPMTASVYGSLASLQSSVALSPGVDNGTMSFYNNGSLIAGAGAVMVGANGVSTFDTANFSAGNHSITSVYNPTIGDPSPMSDAVMLTVTPAPLFAAANTPSKEYDGSTNASITYSLLGFLGNERVTASGTGTFANKNAGSSPSESMAVTLGPVMLANGANGGMASNYVISNTPTSPMGAITPKTLTATASATKVYDGSNDVNVTYALNGLVGSETLAASGNGMFTSNNVGSNSVTLSALSLSSGANGGMAANYVVSNAPIATTGTVTARPLTISATNQTKAFNNTLNLTGNEFSSTGLQNGESIGSVTLTTPMGGVLAMSDAAGTYPIQISAATGGTFDSNNYSITYMPATLTVTNTSSSSPTTATVSPMSPSVYGVATTIAATVSSNPGAGNGTVSFFDNGTPISSGTAVAIDGSGRASFQMTDWNAGAHSITAMYNGGNGYDPSPASAAFTQSVTPATLTVGGITASNITYNGTTVAPISVQSAFLMGILNGDDVSLNVVGASGTFSDMNAGNGKVVTISGVSLSGADAGNYTLTQPTTTATISQANSTTSLTATPMAATGGSPVMLTATVPGGTGTVTFKDNGIAISGGSNISLVNGVATFTTSTLPAGSRTITAEFNGNTELLSEYVVGADGHHRAGTATQPRVVSVTPNGNIPALAGNRQSRIASIVVDFDQPVDLGEDAITITTHRNNVTYGGVAQLSGFGTAPMDLIVTTIDNKRFVVTFTGNTVMGADGFNSLMDGVYDLNVDASKVHPQGVSGTSMAANSTTTFYTLFGDTNGATTPAGGAVGTDFEAILTSGDNLAFRTAFNNAATYNAAFDYNGDGTITSFDHLAFRTRFNKRLTYSV